MQSYYENLRSRIFQWLRRQIRPFATQEAEGGTALGTCRGNIRPDNQDRAIFARYTGSDIAKSFRLWALCDGIGGLQEGSAAAGHALSSVLAVLLSEASPRQIAERVINSIQRANRQVFETYGERGGSTLVLVATDYRGNGLAVSAGDSRLYRTVPGKDLNQLSRDDTIGSQLRLLGNPSISVTGGLFSNQLSQYIGLGTPLELHPIALPDPSDGSSLLLTSDGAHCLSQEVLKSISVSAGSHLDIAKRILYVSLWTGGKDNASVILFPSAALASPLRPEAADVLEIWDPVSKAEFFIDPRVPLEAPAAAQPAQRPITTDKPQRQASRQRQTHIGKRKQRRRQAIHGKHDAQIEIIEGVQEHPAG